MIYLYVDLVFRMWTVVLKFVCLTEVMYAHMNESCVCFLISLNKYWGIVTVPGSFHFIFCCCHVSTQLARQLHQERTQVVCSNKEARGSQALPQWTFITKDVMNE